MNNAHMDKIIIERIEAHTTLHLNVECLYCVDHYEVFILKDDYPFLGPYLGETLFDAFIEAMKNC